MYDKFAGKSADEVHAMVNVERALAHGFGPTSPAVKRAKAELSRVRAAERKAAKQAATQAAK